MIAACWALMKSSALVPASAAVLTAVSSVGTACTRVIAASISSCELGVGELAQRRVAQDASSAYGIVACSIVAMLAFTPATVSSEDSVGLGASPPRLVSHTPMQLEIRVVSTSAVGNAVAVAAGAAWRESIAATVALPAERCRSSTRSNGEAGDRIATADSERSPGRSRRVRLIACSLPVHSVERDVLLVCSRDRVRPRTRL